MAGSRGKQTVRDMVLSLVLIIACAGLVYLTLPHDETEKLPPRVEYQVELKTADRDAPYAIMTPVGLGKEWVPTSVRYNSTEGKTWHLGFHGPEKSYVAVEQSTGNAAAFVDDRARGAEETDLILQIDGRDWRRYEGAGSDDYDALVWQSDDAVTVVTGQASPAQLEKIARALQES